MYIYIYIYTFIYNYHSQRYIISYIYIFNTYIYIYISYIYIYIYIYIWYIYIHIYICILAHDTSIYPNQKILHRILAEIVRWIQRIISAVHSAIRGGMIFGEYLVRPTGGNGRSREGFVARWIHKISRRYPCYVVNGLNQWTNGSLMVE